MAAEYEEERSYYPHFNEYHMRLTKNNLTRQEIAIDGRFDAFDKSVIGRALGPNEKFQPNGMYFETVKGAIEGHIVDAQTLFDIGTTIGYDICQENKTSNGRILGYLNAMAGLDYAKVGLVGGDAPTTTTNGIADYVRLIVTSELPSTEATQRLFSVFTETFDRAKEIDPTETLYDWFATKLHFLNSVFTRQLNASTIARKYSPETLESEYTNEELKQQARLLTKDAMEHRKYGTKPAYIEASIGGSWIFYDGMDWKHAVTRGTRNTRETEKYDDTAAVVLHSPHKDLKGLSVSINYDTNGVGAFTGALSSAESDLLLYIAKDGLIGLDPEGIQDIGFLGLPKTQELALRAEISSNFYDLSMPLYKNQPPRSNFSSLTSPQKETFDPIQDLLIPRIRYIGESEKGLDSTEVTKTVRAHDVTWFVRPLPVGWHPSPDAQVNAAEYGIVLSENETFVKSHTRGKGNKVMVHHAIKRSATRT